MLITYILLTLLVISLSFNLYYFFQSLKPKKPLEQSYEATDLLKDILNGKALVEIKRVAPENFFLRLTR